MFVRTSCYCDVVPGVTVKRTLYTVHGVGNTCVGMTAVASRVGQGVGCAKNARRRRSGRTRRPRSDGHNRNRNRVVGCRAAFGAGRECVGQGRGSKKGSIQYYLRNTLFL